MLTSFTSRAHKILFWVLIGAMLLTLLFIFTNSLRTPEQSMEQSSAVEDFMATVFPPETPFGAFVKEYVRKIGHFVEYGILGVETAVFVSLYLQNKRKMALMSVPAAVCTAFFDETLQYFSGRGPAIMDVWIDLGGFVTFSLFAYGVMYLVARLRVRIKKRTEGTSQNG